MKYSDTLLKQTINLNGIKGVDAILDMIKDTINNGEKQEVLIEELVS